MFYTCNNCRYTFEIDKVYERCPDCGSTDVRDATVQEINEYKLFKDEAEQFYKTYLQEF